MPTPSVLSSFRGGVNTYDPATDLSFDQVVEAANIEFRGAACGERRHGFNDISLSSDVTSRDGVWLMHRHLPGTDESAAQLWVLACTVAGTPILAYKSGSSWTSVTLIDTPVVTAAALTQYAMESLHGKLYVAYPSAVNRLHVWQTGDSALRRVGIAQPAVPVSFTVDTGTPGGGGPFTGTRYYRARFTTKVSSTIVRRSEPSTSSQHVPDELHAFVRVTRPDAINESETHWELEASLDDSTFYKIGEAAMATTTIDDAHAFREGYTEDGTLSEEIGDYTLPPSAKFLAVDNDRLVMGGSWTDVNYSTRVIWTPPFLAPGVGNDERTVLSTDPFVTLDGYEGGEISGMLANNGVVYVGKTSHIYRLIRTGQVNSAYDPQRVSGIIGAVVGSMVAGLDPSGNPAAYFIDRNVGPCMVGIGGFRKVGRDIRRIWDTHSTSSTLTIMVRGVFYPQARQIIWAFTETGETGTSKAIVLHIDQMTFGPEGGTRGWTTFTGPAYEGVTDMILYSDNLDVSASHSVNLVPFVSRLDPAQQHHVLRGDTGVDDDGESFAASITSRPLIPGTGWRKFGVRAASITADAAASTTVDFSLIRDYGLETVSVGDVSLVPTGSETLKLPWLDNARMGGSKAVQVKVADSDPQLGTWRLHQIALVIEPEESL